MNRNVDREVKNKSIEILNKKFPKVKIDFRQLKEYNYKNKMETKMNRDELIELVEKVAQLDEFDVDGKYTEIIRDYVINGDVIAISWKCRHESAELSSYNLNNEDDFGEIEGRCTEALNDLVVGY